MSWTGCNAARIGLIVVVSLGIVPACEAAETICPPEHVAALDPNPFDSFGYSVAVCGDVALIGAIWDWRTGGDAGAAYVFRRMGGRWVQEQKLTVEGSYHFAYAVDIEGDVAVIGATGPVVRGIGTGSAYVFRFNPQLMQWQQEQVLQAADLQIGEVSGFGRAVALQADTIVVGNMLYDNHGSAYVFRFDGDRWWEQQKLIAGDPRGGAFFGQAVSLDGDALLIGAPGVGAFTSGGAAYVFQFDGARWVEQVKLVAQNPGPGGILADFGEAVAIVEQAGDLQALIGAPNHELPGVLTQGAVYSFRGRGGRWKQEQQFFASDPDHFAHFGQAIALAGDRAVIGAPGSDAGAPNNGAAYLFGYDSLTAQWVQQDQLLPPATGVTFTPFFGWSVGFDGDSIIIGAFGEAQQSGSAYLYSFDPIGADLNCDSVVDGLDVMILLESWGPLLPSPAPGSGSGAGGEGASSAADLDGNGIVNGYDLALLLAVWG